MKSLDLLLRNGKIKLMSASLTLCLVSGSLNTWSQSLVPELTFTNPRLQTGPGCAAAGEDSAVYIFSNVGYGIDALVAIRSRSSADVHLTDPDWNGPADTLADNESDNENAWQPRVTFRNGEAPAHSRWWMEFSISFVSHDDHSKPVQVNQFLVTGLHLGGDGKHLHEFQTYYQPRAAERSGTMQTSFVKGCLESRVEQGMEFAGRISPDNGSGARGDKGSLNRGTRRSSSGSDDLQTVVNTVYRRTSRVVLRVGAETGAGGSVAADRAYAFRFRSLFFDVPEVKPAPVMMLAVNNRNSMYQPELALGHRND